ncbi:phosphoglycerate dehydrogenase [Enterococcus gallinarum]|uniref:phosphoglycerate dehydrogenase n=1 Tax=Enterococcus gallinarum TaxID=1353 RepID=UPI0015C53D54|nr:phosphoglycerate dehydrogenase [Enterococcus gallinarum]NQE03364.1 hydroxyacid dehydrogenase [Enterococcus gallinarum]
MTKYILSIRNFREEFIEKMNEIAPDYQFIHWQEGIELDWEKVQITIGWNESWAVKLLKQNTSLKWVQAISAGIDYLPLQEFLKYNLLLSNGSGIHAQSITDHLLALLYMDSRGIFQSIRQQQQRTWNNKMMDYYDLSEQRILIIGTGQIGQKLAGNLLNLGIPSVGINTSGHPAKFFKETYSLTELTEQAHLADYIINILPLTTATTKLFNASFFKKMKRTGSFYNVGRGPSVDTPSLIHALENKQIKFAALDVFEKEPLPEDSQLWTLDNLLITPHISGMTPHFEKAFMKIFLKNLESFVIKGKLLRNQVDLAKGY